MRSFPLFSFLIAASLLVFFPSCDPPVNNACATDFDQLSLLSNVGNNIILPAYDSLANDVDSLSFYTTLFNANPSVNNLGNLRHQFQKAWKTWQRAAIFEFGPADTEDLRSYLNNYPVFVTRLNDAITSGTYDLTSETYSFTRGFPALDYLLYGVGTTDNDVIIQYTSDPQATNRKQYLTDVTTLIQQKVRTVFDAWKPTGANYLNTFTTTDGVANGKPMSDFVNQLSQGYELFKNNKLGTPISAKTGYIPLLPQNVEAYYSGKSLDLALEAATANKNAFMGVSNGVNGVGLDDYLTTSGAKKGSEDLHTAIINQYDLAITSLQALQPSSLQDAINNNLNAVKAAYANAQNQMVMIKTDMPSALCVSITYIDNVDDGD